MTVPHLTLDIDEAKICVWASHWCLLHTRQWGSTFWHLIWV